MKIKVSEASGPVLDWMVAKCQGYTDLNPSTTDCQRRLRTHNYSSNWNKAGPIIEREKITVEEFDGEWTAAVAHDPEIIRGYGPTPLIAAMRCFVTSKLGDEVDVPDELL